jgi:hypothetical protein
MMARSHGAAGRTVKPLLARAHSQVWSVRPRHGRGVATERASIAETSARKFLVTTFYTYPDQTPD